MTGEHLRERPRLRGVMHLVAFCVSLVSGPILVLKAAVPVSQVASVVFGIGMSSALGVSALYHRIWWSQRARRLMRKIDHSMIFVLVAATYTPVVLLTLHQRWRAHVLVAIWVAALVGILLRLFWTGIPRWLLVSVYLVFGWIAVVLMPVIQYNAGQFTFLLFMIGGLCYTLGAIVYLLKRPNPFPTIFGFHEIFHVFVVAGVSCHYAAVYPLIA